MFSRVSVIMGFQVHTPQHHLLISQEKLTDTFQIPVFVFHFTSFSSSLVFKVKYHKCFFFYCESEQSLLEQLSFFEA